MKPHPLIAAVSGILLLAGFHAFAQDQTTDAPAAPTVKIATVDMQELFKQYYRTNEAQKQINVERTLPQIRSTRRKRKIRRIAVGAAACCVMAIWLTPQSCENHAKPTALIGPTPQKIETMAVMRVAADGTIRLKEIASNELGSIEFAFGQTPLLSSEWVASVNLPDVDRWD